MRLHLYWSRIKYRIRNIVHSKRKRWTFALVWVLRKRKRDASIVSRRNFDQCYFESWIEYRVSGICFNSVAHQYEEALTFAHLTLLPVWDMLVKMPAWLTRGTPGSATFSSVHSKWMCMEPSALKQRKPCCNSLRSGKVDSINSGLLSTFDTSSYQFRTRLWKR